MRLIVGLFECSDGTWIQVHTGPRGAFDRMLKVVGREDLIDTNAGLHILGIPLEPTVAKDLWGHLDPHLQNTPLGLLVRHFGQGRRLQYARARARRRPLARIRWNENGLVDVMPDGQRRLGKLVRYERTPIEIRREFPAVGEHNRALLTGTHPASVNGNRSSEGFHPNGATPSSVRIGPLDGDPGTRFWRIHGGAVRESPLR